MTKIKFILFLFITQVSFAGIISVDNTNNSGIGSLRQAIINALPGDTIIFNPILLNTGNDTIKLTSSISFSKSLTIRGAFNNNDTIFISGLNSNQVFNVNLTNDTMGRSLYLDSLFLINSYSSSNGGAINFIGEYLSFKNGIIQNSSANYNGGAIFAKDDNYAYFSDVRVDIVNSIIRNNSANSNWGGGICILAQELATVNIHRSIISHNTSLTSGGGIFCYTNIEGTKVNIDSSQITNNISSTSDGGGLCIRTISKSSTTIDSSTFNLTNSNISHNSGLNGGGVHLYLDSYYDYTNYQMKIDNCNISNNNAQENGGGLYIYTDLYSPANYPKMNIYRTTISENHSSKNGGGISIEAPYTVPASSYLSLYESSITSNIAQENGGGIYSESYYTYTNINYSTIMGNNANFIGGGIYSFSYYSHPFTDYSTMINTSTIYNNSADSIAGGIYSKIVNMYDTIIFIKNATIVQNYATDSADGVMTENINYSLPSSSRVQLVTLSSIIADNGNQNIISDSIRSRGYNIFGDSIIQGSLTSDQSNINSSSLNLSPISFNGGITQTLLPLNGSTAINLGNPLDNSSAQNGSFLGVRDIGAAESCISTHFDTIESCLSYQFGGRTYYHSGIYLDTFTNTLGCDSIIYLKLTVHNQFINYQSPISICQGDSTSIFGNIETEEGLYYDSLMSIYGCDSVIIQELILLPTFHDTLTPISICQGDSTFIFGNFETEDNFYYDSLISINGCDSIVTQKLIIHSEYSNILNPLLICQGDSILIFGNYEHDAGLYYDSLVSINGCDSIITQELDVQSIDTSLIQLGTTLTANQTGASYQWIDCDNGNIEISGETNQSYTALSNGNYAVVISMGICSDTSNCININNVGVNESISSYKINAFPNPNEGQFTIDLNSYKSQNSSLQIIDLSGKILQEVPILNTKANVDITSYRSGIYLVKIDNYYIKITKQ